MTLEEFLTRVRSGEVTIWVARYPDPEFLRSRPKSYNAQIGMRHNLGNDQMFALISCINEHSGEIFELLLYSDVCVCAAPEKHWPHWQRKQRLISADEQRGYQHCELCADIRCDWIEGLAEQKVPGAAAIIIEFPRRGNTQAT